MIVTKTSPFTKEEIEKASKELEPYIKTVIDIKKRVCSAGARLHADSEQILLKQGSNQKDLWGGGIDAETKTIDFNAMINIRPHDNNSSNEILDTEKRKKFEDLTKYFFKLLFK